MLGNSPNLQFVGNHDNLIPTVPFFQGLQITIYLDCFTELTEAKNGGLSKATQKKKKHVTVKKCPHLNRRQCISKQKLLFFLSLSPPLSHTHILFCPFLAMKETLKNANFPQDAEGRVYHINVKYGEVANRILTVGDHVRARAISKWLDSEEEAGHPLFIHTSQRGFLTITGRYKGVPVTILAM